MNPAHIPNANRRLAAPRDWDETRNGPCETLELLDTGEFFQSAWVPDGQELACLNAGAPVVLTIWGRHHPPVAVGVMPKPGYVAVEQYQALFHALRNLVFMCRTAAGRPGWAREDTQLVGSVEIAEAIVGEIPGDARRKDGDPEAMKFNPPQHPHREQVKEWRALLDGVPVDTPAFEATKQIDKWLEDTK